jgi:hypothetical protein
MSQAEYRIHWTRAGRPSLWDLLKCSVLFLAIIASGLELLDSYLTVTNMASLPEQAIGKAFHDFARTERLDWWLSVVATTVLVLCASKVWAEFRKFRNRVQPPGPVTTSGSNINVT